MKNIKDYIKDVKVKDYSKEIKKDIDKRAKETSKEAKKQDKEVSNVSLSELDNQVSNQAIIDKLQIALAEEFNQWYMYTIVRPYLIGKDPKKLAKLYDTQAKDELEDHAYWLMDRIAELGGKPERVLSPDMWNTTADHKYIMPEASFDVLVNIEQNIQSEKDAIETYQSLLEFLEGKDDKSYNKIKKILADEEQHLKDLLEIKEKLNK